MKRGLSADERLQIAWRVWEAMVALEAQGKRITDAAVLHELRRSGDSSAAITAELVDQGMAAVAAWLTQTAKRNRLEDAERKAEALFELIETVLHSQEKVSYDNNQRNL